MILFNFLVTFATAYGATFEAKSIQEILPYVKPETLVVFDIDNTLLRPTQTLGSDQWYGHLVSEQISRGLAEREAIAKAISFWTPIQMQTEVEAVEKQTPEWLNELQKKGVKIIALTARPEQLAQTTVSQLNSVGIQLQKSVVNEPGVGTFSNTEVFGGIIFVGPENDKGHVLREYLTSHNLVPNHLIFVDDKAKHTTNMETAMSGFVLKYDGFRYGAADNWVKSFDAGIANCELEAFQTYGIIPTDEACQ